MTGIDDKKKYMIKAAGMPCSCEEVKGVRSSPLPELVNLLKRELRWDEGDVDLLIGIDRAHMHTGPMKHLVARKFSFNWLGDLW